MDTIENTQNVVTPTENSHFKVEINMDSLYFNKEKKESIRHDVAKKYSVPYTNVDVKFIATKYNDSGTKLSLTEGIQKNIQDKNFQKALIKEYLDTNSSKYQGIDRKKIDDIDNKINDGVDFKVYDEYKKYSFKFIRWSNFLSYGDNNYFDFTTLHGLVLLKGHNQCGKTSFAIDLIRFALFGAGGSKDEVNKVKTNIDAFNNRRPQKDEVSIELKLTIENQDYLIRRVLTRPNLQKREKLIEQGKSIDAKQVLEYFKIYENGETELISTQNDAQALIEKTIGSIDDFNLTISASKENLEDLLRMGSTDKGRLFSKWLGLDVVSIKETIAKDEVKKKQAKLLSNTYNRSQLSQDIENLVTQQQEKEKELAEERLKLEESNQKIKVLREEKESYLESKRTIKDLPNVDIHTLEERINNGNNVILKEKTKIDTLNKEIEELKDIVYDAEEYKKVSQQKQDILKDISSLEGDNKALAVKKENAEKEINRLNNLITDGKCPTCGQLIDVSFQNDSIQEYEKKKNNSISLTGVNNDKISSYKKEIVSIEKSLSVMEENDSKSRKRVQLLGELSSCNVNVERYINALENMKRQQKDLLDNEDNIRYNNSIDIKINNSQAMIDAEEKISSRISGEIICLESEIKSCKENKKNREDLIETIDKENIEMAHWNAYLDIIGKNGIVKIVLRKTIPLINEIMKDCSQKLINFIPELQIDSKNNVQIFLRGDDDIAEDGSKCSSGMEAVITSLILRSALSTLATIPHSNFMVLDEIDAAIEKDNNDTLEQVYRRILQNYDFIIHLCHNESLVEIHDQIINVVNDERISHLECDGIPLIEK